MRVFKGVVDFLFGRTVLMLVFLTLAVVALIRPKWLLGVVESKPLDKAMGYAESII